MSLPTRYSGSFRKTGSPVPVEWRFGGSARLSIEAVAREAGVGKPTISGTRTSAIGSPR